MKPETRETVIMILKADGTVTQQLMDAVVLALDGGTFPDIVTREEAREALKVSSRFLDRMAKKGRLERVMGTGSRGIGYTRASFAGVALALSLKRGKMT